MSTMFAGITAGAGLLTSLYGANKQSKDDAHTRDLNYLNQKEAERQNWANWLASRGVAPGPEVQTGVIPGTVTGQAINTRLPLWMKVSVPQLDNPYQTSGAAAAAATMPFITKKRGVT